MEKEREETIKKEGKIEERKYVYAYTCTHVYTHT
jgi:hypothetical protein